MIDEDEQLLGKYFTPKRDGDLRFLLAQNYARTDYFALQGLQLRSSRMKFAGESARETICRISRISRDGRCQRYQNETRKLHLWEPHGFS